MRTRKKFLPDALWYIAGFIFVSFVYRGWLLNPEIIGGDWPYIFPGMIRNVTLIPPAWGGGYGGGAGGVSPAYFLAPYMQFTEWLSVTTHIAWPFVYKVFWFCLPLVIITTGGHALSYVVFPSMRRINRIISSIILATNTYILMITSGGQMGVVLSVSLTPWVYLLYEQFRHYFIEGLKKDSLWRLFKSSVLFGVIFGIQFAFDARIGYVQILGLGMVFLATFGNVKHEIRFVLYGAIPLVIVLLLNAYWILPLYVLRFNPLSELGSAYTTVEALRFFSFADFSHSISLLHPNWPENVFGKTYFLQPEYLLLPFIAFSSLLIREKSKRKSDPVLYFSLLGLVGLFLSKGVNPPFGVLYAWMFEHIPGFVMFRDPTKFYVLITLSYSMLIPKTLDGIGDVMNRRIKISWIAAVISMTFLLFWIVLIRQTITGEIRGTFSYREVHSVYRAWEDRLTRDNSYWRTLWVPRQSRFTYTSEVHPSIESEPLLSATDSSSIILAFNQPDVQEKLQALSIRYVAIAFDPYGELFVDDRKYSPQKRRGIEEALDSISWLRKVQSGHLTIYETSAYKEHFYLQDTRGVVEVTQFSPDVYHVTISAETNGTLVFSESYSPYWRMNMNQSTMRAVRGPYGTMQFSIPKGVSRVEIEFAPRHTYATARWVTIGGIVMVLMFFLMQSRFDAKQR